MFEDINEYLGCICQLLTPCNIVLYLTSSHYTCDNHNIYLHILYVTIIYPCWFCHYCLCQDIVAAYPSYTTSHCIYIYYFIAHIKASQSLKCHHSVPYLFLEWTFQCLCPCTALSLTFGQSILNTMIAITTLDVNI